MGSSSGSKSVGGLLRGVCLLALVDFVINLTASSPLAAARLITYIDDTCITLHRSEARIFYKMTPLPALVAQDGSLIPALRIGNETEKYTADPLDKIFAYTPIPTVILDSSLRVVEVSKSYSTLFSVDKGKVLGSPLFNLHDLSASHLPLMLGALNTAISTRSIQLTDSPWGGCDRLQVTPIFDRSSLLYLTLEFQTTTSTSSHQ